jgi:hypothetical protein
MNNNLFNNWPKETFPFQEKEAKQKENKNGSKKEYTCGSLVPKLSKADMGKENLKENLVNLVFPDQQK